MSFKKGIDYTTDESIKEVYIAAKEVFGNGIAVPSNQHPCNWDWIDFSYVENEEEVLSYQFDLSDISDGIYEESEFNGKTLREILIITEGRFLLEINTFVNWN